MKELKNNFSDFFPTSVYMYVKWSAPCWTVYEFFLFSLVNFINNAAYEMCLYSDHWFIRSALNVFPYI